MGERRLILVLSTLFLIGLIGSVNAGYYVLYNDDTEYPPTTHTYDNPNGYIINVTMEDSRWTSTSTQVCLTFNYVNGSTAPGGCNSCLYQTWVERVYTNPNPTWEVESTTSTGGTNVYVGRYNAYAETDETVFSVNLTNITNGQSIATNSTILNASYSMAQENYSYQWRNVTYYIWTNEGLYNTSATITLTGNTTTSSYEKSDYAADKMYYWNVYACYDNTTFGKCQWSNNGNWTFYNYYPSTLTNTLTLNFTYINETARNVSIYITDENRTIVNTSSLYVDSQYSFTQGMVLVRILKGIYNISAYMNWSNVTQFYEYDNTVPEQIYENITILDTLDTVSYFKTLDNSGNIVRDVRIRVYGVKSYAAFTGTSRYNLYGQRYTGSNGQVVFPLDSDMEYYIEASKTGYETKTVHIMGNEIESITSDTAYEIVMQSSPYTAKMSIFLTGLYELNGTRIEESNWDSLTNDYFMHISDYYLRDIKYSTSFEGTNNTVTLDTTTKRGLISLLSGEQISNTSNSTWYLYIWVDDVLDTTIVIAYDTPLTQTVIFDIDSLGLRDSLAWKWVIFLLIVGISVILGLSFGGAMEDVGVHTFMIGSMIAPIMADGLIMTATVGAFFYVGKMIKTWVKE